MGSILGAAGRGTLMSVKEQGKAMLMQIKPKSSGFE